MADAIMLKKIYFQLPAASQGAMLYIQYTRHTASPSSHYCVKTLWKCEGSACNSMEME